MTGTQGSGRGTQEERIATELAAVVGRLGRQLRAASSAGELTPSMRAVLHRVRTGGATTIAELARAELVRPQSMRATVGALEERGVLERSPHPSDGRQVVFALTEAGLRTVDELRRAKHDWLVETLGTRLSPGEKRTLEEATGILRRLMDD